MISPSPTVSAKYGNILHPPTPDIISTIGIITEFETIVETDESMGVLIKYVITAAIRVAMVPKTISYTVPPQIMFAIKQPIVTPGTADRVKMGSTHKASDILICIAPEERPNAAEIMVRATYAAAIIAECAINCVLLFFIFFPFEKEKAVRYK